MTDVPVWTLVVLYVLGFGGLVTWLKKRIGLLEGNIRTLEGTVKTQEQALKAVGDVSKTVLDAFRTMEPERWLAEVKVHKQLADEKLEALLAKGQRELDEKRAGAEAKAAEFAREVLAAYRSFFIAALSLIPYVPKSERDQIVRAFEVPEDMRDVLLEYAKRVPEHGSGFASISRVRTGLSALAVFTQEESPVTPPPLVRDPKRGGMDVR